jgi:hypothetical protein
MYYTFFKADFTFQTEDINYYCLVNKNKPFINTENETNGSIKDGIIADLIINSSCYLYNRLE